MNGGRVVVGVSGSPASLAALRRGAEEAFRGGRTLVPVLDDASSPDPHVVDLVRTFF